MKFTWGVGLAAGFTLFVLIVLILVGIAVSNRVDLVTDRYYDKGIHYQEQINTLQRTALREEKLLIRQDSHSVTLEFPRCDLAIRPIGTITMYRPSDRHRDFMLTVAPDPSGIQHIATGAFDHGLWRIQVAWQEGNQEYFSELPIMID
jgi:hypothetical protein